ncbi:AraC family transcriptional regulator [Olivibacter ginsenosidimutans]|uniref:AraC family transcriptional regulator n=1 Tax=Olivibacter ginsenosidimutans TaxID=1176537 RepID=A0ABP9BT32_9SPHI
MYIHLELADVKEMMLEHIYPDNNNPFSGPIKEHHLSVQEKLINLNYHEIYFDGIHIGYGDLHLQSKTFLHFEMDHETVEMHFTLIGNTACTLKSIQNKTYGFCSNQHNLIYTPGIKGQLDFNSANCKILEVNLSPRVLEKYLLDTDAFFPFLRQIRSQNLALLGQHHLTITQEMMQVIQAITSCSKTGTFKKMYLEAKVIDLLLLQLEQFASHDCNEFCVLRPRDIEKMHHARDIIFNNIRSPLSLRQLALEIGSNEFTLKKGFKTLFGTTVFGMINDLRMQYARQLIVEGNLSLKQISEQVGYKNISHFTSSFKRKFGLTPGRFMRNPS